VSLLVYTIIAYFSARLYLLLTLEREWPKYWPVISVLFLVSCGLSYYFAFGTLIPNTNISTSSGFIHSTLYGSEFFSDPEAAKGIRHTMAIVPTLLLAMLVHNKRYTPKLGIVIFLGAVYLVLFSFSRSAWLVAFLIIILIMRSSFKNFSKNIGMIYVSIMLATVALPVLAMLFPQQFSWVWGILEDRLADDKSAEGRLWMMGQIISGSSFSEYLFGYNRVTQGSPHNMIFDALLQSGLLGAVGAIVIAVYAIRVYFAGLIKGNHEAVLAAAFAAPALVRIFTAGSGMLHIADIMGLCIAANLGWYSVRKDKNVMA